ncbi:MAG TPA: sigma-70 family RNA polymerase sigma factor [Verrucomicrobiae bacterium]|nr:sigma-70 family RNA polymerase sigma factor [Verrucomicrobiae bacterium]
MAVNDFSLLRQYAVQGSEDAFSALVERHLDLVYSTALRQVRSQAAAEEIAQSVFADLARNASKLKPDTVLAAWLYQVTRRTSIDMIRRESRRQIRERTALELSEMNQDASPWKQIEPLLDDAMEELEDKDRSAIILRFFENKSLREVGEIFGTSEDAAQKRVNRAIEKLREHFSQRGATASAAAIAAALSAHAVHSAPIGLMTAISTGAVVSGAPAATAAAATKVLTMTTIQKVLVTVAITAAVGTGIYGTRRFSRLETELSALQQNEAPLRAQIEALRRERDLATNHLAVVQTDSERFRRDSMELQRLRGEVGLLRREARDSAQAKGASNDPFVQTAVVWKEKEAKLRALIEQRPNNKVPELGLLEDRAWLDIARDAELESEEGIRKTLSELRRSAGNRLAPMLEEGLNKYLEANDGRLPDQVAQLKQFLDPRVTDAMLDRYQLLYTGKLADVPHGEWVLGQSIQSVVDQEYDPRWKIGPNGYGTSTVKTDQLLETLKPAMQAYSAANAGQSPKGPIELLPYLQTAEQKKAFDQLMKKP